MFEDLSVVTGTVEVTTVPTHCYRLHMVEETAMAATRENLLYELTARFAGVTGKTHLSLRWEPGPRIVRVGACLDDYTWEKRQLAIQTLLQFESDHADEFALEFDVVPLDAVNDEAFAEA